MAPETEYEVQVQAAGSDEWTESVRFTTLEQQTEPAVTPTELTEQEVGEDYATISWTGNGETSWNVRYRKNADDSEWTVVEGVTENPYTVEGLESGTAYDFQVQAIGEGGDVSEWSETLTFTTSMPDAIVEVASETATDNVWYNINGARLNGKPTQKGVYILNGKKAIVK